MATSPRSPRAPSIGLEEALKKALILYDENGKHPIPADLAAKRLGYTGANNGSAAKCLASLKAFGLLESNNKGDLSAASALEDYRHTPDAHVKEGLLVQWLRSPKIYDELLADYHDRLPSDQAVRYKLIKRGFNPTSAEECLKSFKSSVQFVDYFNVKRAEPEVEPSDDTAASPLWGEQQPPTIPQSPNSLPPHPAPQMQHPQLPPLPAPQTQHPQLPPLAAPQTQHPQLSPLPPVHSTTTDRIPVRLSKGRRAWIEVPFPFYAADKDMLKDQIDLIFTDDEEMDLA